MKISKTSIANFSKSNFFIPSLVILLVIVGWFFLLTIDFTEEDDSDPVSWSQKEEKIAESSVNSFMSARMKRNEELSLSWLTDNAEGQYLLRNDMPLIGLSNPHFTDFKILEKEKLNPTQFRFKIRIYEEFTGEGMIGYFEETLIVIKIGEDYLINSLENRSSFFGK